MVPATDPELRERPRYFPEPDEQAPKDLGMPKIGILNLEPFEWYSGLSFVLPNLWVLFPAHE